MTMPRQQHAEQSFPATRRSEETAFATLAQADGLAAYLALAGAIQNKEAAHTRSDSGLSEAATECGCDSPIPSSQMPKAAAPSSDAREVRSVRREDILEVFHVDARLREVRRPRGQKLQSPFD